MTNEITRDEIPCDVAIIGAGPAGLSAAIRLAQLAKEAGAELTICVVEKGSEVGAHILSGAVLEPRALNELLPDWKERGAPLNTPVDHDRFVYLTEQKSYRLPTPPQMENKGNYIISLGNFCRWLGREAEALGVQIFPGFPAADILLEEGKVAGIITGDFGIGHDGKPKVEYQPGIIIRAKYTLFAEGCRGSLAQRLMQNFDLRRNADPQTYGIGIKELWEVDPAKHKLGQVTHTLGWPLESDTYGGSFIYHLENNQVAIGYVIGLDYSNPNLDPFLEFQRFKHHPDIKPLLEGGRRLSYGARAINEGGWQSLPDLAFAGGALIGDAAGFLNVPKIKGTHTCMKSGMLAAEAAFAALAEGREGDALAAYPEAVATSWLGAELRSVRNIRPGFKHGLWIGLLNAALETITRGKLPWTLRNHADHTQLLPLSLAKPITYPKPDGVVSFDRMSSVYLSNTNHAEDQPVHLRLRDPEVPVALNLPEYGAPEQRYCPAGVYEIVQEAAGPRLQINAQNCVHCKTCDIKDPTQNILWVTPEGGGGPNYPNM
jgi:electron-transferring-flavoprotein dehydrogenase